MRQTAKRVAAVFLALVLLALCAAPAFGLNAAYPADVTQAAAASAAKRTDILVKNAATAFTGRSLSASVYTSLFADETLSGLLKGVYDSADERSAAMTSLGLDTSPAALAGHLRAWPSVAARLKNAESWSDVDLSGAKWNVTGKEGFAAALSAMFAPFNDLLYMLLCGGTARIGLLPVRGDLGYENGLVPILRALGCPAITAPASFYARAKADRSAMVKAVVSSLLSLVDALCAAPAAKLTSTLPGLAAFIRSGEFEDAVDEILHPLSVHIGPYVELFSGSQMLSVLLFVQSPGTYTMDFTQNVTKAVNGMLEDAGVKVAEIDLDAFAACRGKPTDCFMVLMRWLIATLRLNESALGDLADGEMAALLEPLLSGLLRHGDEWLLSTYVHLLTDAEGTLLEVRPQQTSFTRGSVDFPHNLKRKQMKRVVEELDDVLGEFTADATGDDLSATLSKLIYSSDTITALVKGVYGALLGEEAAGAGALLGLPATPAALAAKLPGRLSSAKTALYRAKTWENLGKVFWGFSAGSRNGFSQALTAVLSPFRPLLEAFLANGVFELLGAVRIGGTNGYNTAVLPLLEALCCPTAHLKPYAEYVTGKGTDRILTDILIPVLDLVDKVIASPTQTLTGLLPNFLFFVKNGGLSDCAQHLLAPVTMLLDTAALSLEDFGLDLSALDDPDLSTLLSDTSAQLDAASLLDDVDWALIATLGKATDTESKRVFHGKPVDAVYIKSDRSAVLLTLLRGIITAVKRPENADLMTNMIAQSSGDNAMFTQYSAGIGEQMNDMTTDELLEWLYNLLFRERATKEIKEDDGYVPDFDYEPAPKHTLRNVLLALGILGVLTAGVVVLWRRKEIAAWRSRRKAAKETEAPGKEET